jgi:Fe-S-cluster containining protein
MNNGKDLRFVCTRCGNCCTDKDTLVNLTYLDILRIKNGLNLNNKEILKVIGFYIFDKKLSKAEENRLVIKPIESEKGLAFIALLKKATGECYFYSSKKKKCLIYELRPFFCRTFPFSFKIFDKKKKESSPKLEISYTEKGKKYCPGIENSAPIIDYNYWINLGKNTLVNLEKNRIVIERWNKKVKQGEIIPSAKRFIDTILKLNES